VVQSYLLLVLLEVFHKHVVMSCEQCPAMDSVREESENAVCDGVPIEGAGAPPKLIHDHQTILRALLQDCLRFLQLYKECAFVLEDAIASSNACEDSVH